MTKKYNWLNHLLNFLAVILGVYLAFYINEKAKSNDEKKESLLLMRSLSTDLSEDIKRYEKYQIPVNIQHLESIDSLLNFLMSDDLTKINEHLPAILQLENYIPTTSTYSSIKASGKIKLIGDITLQKKLTDFYEGLVMESVKKSEFQVEFFSNELLGWLTENADLMNMEILNKESLIILRNKLIIYQSIVDQKVNNYKMVATESEALKTHLDSILISG